MPELAAELCHTTEQGPCMILSTWIRTAHGRGAREPETVHLRTCLPPERCASPLQVPPRFGWAGALIRAATLWPTG